MMRLHHADELEPLLDALADVLGGAVADPFVPELVVVPSMGMRDAVVAGLARRLGVSAPGAADGVLANVEFEFPARFVGRALGDATCQGELPADPWQIERLTWAVLDVMTDGSIALPRVPDPAERWALARQIADLFDRYATQRPQMILEWARGADVDATTAGRSDRRLGAPLSADHVWQPALWRAVRSRLGVSSPPEVMPVMLAQISAGDIVAALPSRVSLFGFATLPTGMLSVARALAAQRSVHAFLRHPSSTAWQRSPLRLAGSLTVREGHGAAAHAENALLASWGRPSLEAAAVLNGMTDIEQVAVAEPPVPAPSTALRAVQRGVRLNLPVARADEVQAADGSLQVHACHGDIRQLEVLRDALGHAFAADAGLAAHDVVVISPRLDDFAPLIESVFSRGTLPIPVSIGDRSLSSADPLGDALIAVLDTVAGRATLSQVLGLLQHPPIRDRIGWDSGDIEHVSAWAGDLGARWGLDTAHRRAWHLPDDIVTGTWRSLVDRLLLGVAMPAATARVAYGGIAPHDDMGTDEALIAGSLADLIGRLLEASEAVREPRPIASWIDTLHHLVDLLLVESRDEPWGRRALHRMLDSVADAATVGGKTCEVDLEIGDVVRMLRRTVAERPGRLRLRTGAVTVTSMLPVHGIPARIVCILGLDDGALRAGTFEGDDVLSVNQCIGERHPRHESRQMLLDAVLAARDQLIITCNGADLTTNKEVPFVVPLVELLDVADAVSGARGSAVVRHPRHGFSERALVPGQLVASSAQPFTFDATMLAAAQARRTSAGAEVTRTSWSLTPLRADTVELDALLDAVGRPSRAYLQRRLDVRLPADPSIDEDGLSIGVDPLGLSALGRALLAELRRGGTSDEWRAAAAHDGTLPPAALGERVITAVVDEVEAMAAMAADANAPLWGAVEVSVNETWPSLPGIDEPAAAPADGDRHGVRVAGALTGVHIDGITASIVDIQYRRPKPSLRLGMAVRLAAAQHSRPDLDWRGVLVTRGATGTVPTCVEMRLRGDAGERAGHAERLLALALELSEWSTRDAVPLYDEISESLAHGRIAAAAALLDEADRDAYQALLWPDLSLASLLDDPVLPTDPMPVRDLAARTARSRAMCTAMWVWGIVDGAIEEVAVRSAGAATPDGTVPAGTAPASAGEDGRH